MTPPAEKFSRLARILTIQSGRELVKYKSFFLLIFGLIALDRAVHHVLPAGKPATGWPGLEAMGERAAAWVFDALPGLVADRLTDGRTLAVVAGLFLLKQIISLWPSSDMRRMHRRERERFGLVAALGVLRWWQVAWDAVAVSSICAVVGGWGLIAFGATRIGWLQARHPIWLAVLAALLGLIAPLGMAGFSYSSKLAVLSKGSFGEKLGLFFRLFTDRRVLWTSWLFFLFRIVVETLFVAAIPTGAILLIDSFGLRLAVAAVSATPVYAYLKMATFKFFLFTYGRFDLVRQEYPEYFKV